MYLHNIQSECNNAIRITLGFLTEDFRRQAVITDHGDVKAKEQEEAAKSEVSHVDWFAWNNSNRQP